MEVATLPITESVGTPSPPGAAEQAPAAISASGLRKRYGNFEAVRGIDLTVMTGEVFAFLGPNGAGKTTTVEILEGYRHRDGGEVRVLGVDPAHPTRAWRSRVGLVLQASRMPEELTVREMVARYAGYYPHPRGVDETIELVGLGDKRNARAGSLSGGQLRRLDVGIALVGDPEMLFLDEPTTGFDPAARRQAWSLVASLKPLGKTVFLTTHYMDEAEALADRVAVIVRGQIVATGTPSTLAGRNEAAIDVRFREPAGLNAAQLVLVDVHRSDGWVDFHTTDTARDLGALMDWSREHHVELEGLEVRHPSLEDVYLSLVGGEKK
jgi:ABC-2 type transport system ATP-binding protein